MPYAKTLRDGLFCMVVALSICAVSAARGRSESQTIEGRWKSGNGSGFIHYRWSRQEDSQTVYESILAGRFSVNSIYLYSTANRYPIGEFARCGGLGCDLEVGKLLGLLIFTKQGDILHVHSGTMSLNFLTGAQCVLTERPLPTLKCYSLKTPVGIAMPSMFEFSSGT